MKISFLHRPKPKQFSYKPRFYDPVKEDIEERIKAHHLEGDAAAGERIKLNFKREWEKKKAERKRARSGRMRLLVMLVLLALLLYIVLK